MYLDSAIIVKLVIHESDSHFYAQALQGKQGLKTCALSRTECFAALCRKQREAAITEAVRKTAWSKIEAFFGTGSIHLIPLSDPVLERVEKGVARASSLRSICDFWAGSQPGWLCYSGRGTLFQHALSQGQSDSGTMSGSCSASLPRCGSSRVLPGCCLVSPLCERPPDSPSRAASEYPPRAAAVWCQAMNQIDLNEAVGYTFGMGIERIAMILYGIDDIRLFYENDVRFLGQF